MNIRYDKLIIVLIPKQKKILIIMDGKETNQIKELPKNEPHNIVQTELLATFADYFEKNVVETYLIGFIKSFNNKFGLNQS